MDQFEQWQRDQGETPTQHIDGAEVVRPKVEYLTCAETAKLVRSALKAAFPGVKFSVCSSTYSGGASIDTPSAPPAPAELWHAAQFCV